MTKAATYLRISSDPTGQQFGIGTQRKHTTALVEARGWQLVEEYSDNDTSASKERGPGTAWARMLNDAKAGKFDVVVAVDMDRLLRRTQDLVTLIEAGVKIATADGELDLSTADGEFRGSMLAAIARFEASRKRERQMRAYQQRREQGMLVNPRKVLGYSADGSDLVEDEADAIRRAYTDFLAGVSLGQIARDWNAQGFATSRGNPFRVASVRYVLSSPRNAGMILHHESGNVYPGSFPAIVSEDTWRAAADKLRDPARISHSGTQPRWLLSGQAWCGRCGERKIKIGATDNGVRKYRCGSHLSRLAEPTDEYISELVIARLSEPDAVELFAPDGDDIDREALRDERVTVQARMDGLAGLYADGVLDGDSVRSTSAALRKRLNEIDSTLTEGPSSILEDVASADDVRAVWDGLDAVRRRAVMDALMEVTLLPVGRGRGGFGFDYRTIHVEWKE
ncbi:recombinase family protein [Brevibacterium yomogidense]|uniref:recombinase family protein n=1 Tax=Brevibacterium yomogidense TaxID=946573 RepID=UPI0018DFA2B0|nr:recombinase family protein [Brevibacterium yomogidense]